MKRGRIHHLLLVMAFLASQMIAFAHATHHEFVGHGADGCQICAIADAVPVPPSAVVVALHAGHGPVLAPPSMIDLTDRRPFARPNTRGPPSRLA